MSLPKTIEEVPNWVIVNALRCSKDAQISIVAKLLQHLGRDQMNEALRLSGHNSMSWIKRTDDPATLPPLDVPVFVTDGNDFGVVAIRTWVADGDDSGWLWAQCYGMPYWNCVSKQWDCSNAEIDDLTVTHWHELPKMVEGEK